MKTTESKDLVKVNQILPVMHEYFVNSMNLAHIKFMAYMLHALCIRQDIWVVKPSTGEKLECGGSSIPLKSDRRNSTTNSFCIKGSMSISPEVESRTLTGYPNFKFLSVSTDLRMEYRPIKKRWEIETTFRVMKSSGFNIEDTLLRDKRRIARLFAMERIALVWAYLVGEHKDLYVKPIRILKHGRRA